VHVYEAVSLSKFFVRRSSAPSGPESPHCRCFLITPRQTTLRSAPRDEWLARCRDLYLTTHYTHKTQKSMPPAGFESAIPASQRRETHALERAATGAGLSKFCKLHSLIHNDTSLNSVILSLTSFIVLNIQQVKKRRHIVFDFIILTLFKEKHKSTTGQRKRAINTPDDVLCQHTTLVYNLQPSSKSEA